ncbi:DUF6194 family protein [Cellulomonas sp. URHE0023]|uniref:DUF6194 family protein n=1 Tax=Cellulomonas sp. URHE0023 TaxID=1380354 RepID=UPI0004831D25|nr:DUF6194 family protein [Cellulomonas sp. URHE0023]
MELDQVLSHLRSLDGILVLAPTVGSEFPEIAWGDYFFYYAPDGEIPATTQPFATIVTKDYPDDDTSQLDDDGRWRVNIHVGRGAVPDPPADPAEADVVHRHPVYGELGWVAVTNPAERTGAVVVELLDRAHAAARARWDRRADV